MRNFLWLVTAAIIALALAAQAYNGIMGHSDEGDDEPPVYRSTR